MKCPKCGNSVFKGQFRCEKCRTILPKAEEPKQEQAKPKTKNKEK